MPTRLVALVAIGIAVSYATLQGCYARADRRKAIELVRGYRPRGATAGAPPLGEHLAALHPERAGDARFSAEVLSDCRGVVRVVCEVPRPEGAAAYPFDVDLTRSAIHPADARAREALAAFAGGAGRAGGPGGNGAAARPVPY